MGGSIYTSLLQPHAEINMKSKRKPNWREEEILLLVELVGERKLIIKGKFNPTLTSYDKKQTWEDIANQLYASQAFCHRSPADCEKKRYNALSKSRTEIAAFMLHLHWYVVLRFHFLACPGSSCDEA